MNLEILRNCDRVSCMMTTVEDFAVCELELQLGLARWVVVGYGSVVCGEPDVPCGGR